jgi:hypothetical protein
MEKSDGLEYLESEPGGGGNKACGSPSFWVKSSQNDLEMAARGESESSFNDE